MNGDQRTEQGLIVEVQIEKSNLEDGARIMNEKYHPTWMGRRFTENGTLYRVHVVEDFIHGGPKSELVTDAEISRMIQAKEMTEKTLERMVE